MKRPWGFAPIRLKLGKTRAPCVNDPPVHGRADAGCARLALNASEKRVQCRLPVRIEGESGIRGQGDDNNGQQPFHADEQTAIAW